MHKFFTLFFVLSLPVIFQQCLPGFRKESTKVQTGTVDFDTLTTYQLKEVGDNLIRHRVSIFNNSYKRFSFEFGDKKSRDTFSIEAQKQWNSPYSKTNPTLKFAVGKKKKTIKLELGKKYNVLYYPTKKSWDLKQTK